MQMTEDNNLRFHINGAEAVAVYESRLQHVWNNVDTAREYPVTPLRRVRIESPGTWNTAAGPDFLNCRLRIDGKVQTGAVEIHYRASDWFRHHHHLDRRYDQVILHLVEIDDVEPVASASLPPVLLFKDLKVAGNNTRIYRKGKCEAFFSRLSNERVQGILVSAGLHRFRRKADQLSADILNHGADYVALKMIFRALGYKQNHDNFMELFNRFMEYPSELRQSNGEAILWGESGLLPRPDAPDTIAELKPFVSDLWRQWGLLRISARPPIDWIRCGIRPYNSPERRLAALVRLCAKVGNAPATGFLSHCRPEGDFSEVANQLVAQLTCSDPLWDCHTSFTASGLDKGVAVLGFQQALEIAVNVILPVLHIYGRISQDGQGIADAAAQVWLQLPPTQDNRIVRETAQTWFQGRNSREILASAAARQGILHLHQEYCHKCQSDCDSCLFYNSL